MEFLLQAQGGGSGDSLVTLFIPMGVMFAIFYFMVIRPQQRERKAQEEQRNTLKKGDRVLTQGGILAVVHAVRDKEVVLELEEGRLTVVKSAISQVFREGAPTPAKVGKG